MKKVTLLLFLLSLTIVPAFTQNIYYILNIKGTVKLKNTGAVLMTNSQISEKDALLFSTPTDAVAVISTKSGRMILKPKPNAKASELVCIVSEILNPGTGRLSARAGLINNAMDMNNYFSIDSLTILGSTKVWISPTSFPMNDANFFFVRYTWKGETINKKLSFEKDSLILNANDIYKVDGNSISAREVTSPNLYYRKGNEAIPMCPFNISFADEASLKEMTIAFKKHSTKKGNDFLEEFKSLLKDIYGNTDKDNVRFWLKKTIGTY